MRSLDRADKDCWRALCGAVAGALLTTCAPSWSQSSSEGDDEPAGVSPAIHATRLTHSEFDVPEAVTTITAEEIRRSGYVEISEIFRAVPGFRVVKIGDESRVSYHGTSVRQNRRMRVTVDGRNVLVADGQYVEFDRLPIDLDDIRRVTITRGPNAAAFGENAFMASIDFETIGRDDPEGTAIRIGGGDNGRRRLGVGINDEVAGVDLAFSAGSERDGGYDYLDANKTPRDDGKEIKRARLTLSRDTRQNTHWRLDASAYESDHRSGFRPLRITGEQTNDGAFIGIGYSREIGDSSRIDWLVSHNRQRENLRQIGCYTPEAIAGARTLYTDPQQLMLVLAPTLFVPSLLRTTLADTCFYTDRGIQSRRNELEVEYESRVGAWRYVVGGSATYSEASSQQYFAGRDQEQQSYRAFGESAATFGNVHASFGVMAQDASNVDNIHIAWRAALNWQFRPEQMIRYTYSDSFRIPSLVETETLWTGAFLFGRRGEPLSDYRLAIPIPLITGNQKLVPERIKAHSVGYFGAFRDSSTLLDVKVFEERISAPIEAGLMQWAPPPFNSESFTLRGVEGEISLRLSEQWRLSWQYSYLENTARRAFERGMHGDHGRSLAINYQPHARHSVSAAYYGNSDISGHSYDRYDLVYFYSRTFGNHQLRTRAIYQHHVGGVDGLHDPLPYLSDEGYFEKLDQFFFYVELTF